MAWVEISEETRPGEGEFVEVELANGTMQLAQFVKGRWQAPSSGSGSGAAEFSNVIKWRPFSDAHVPPPPKRR